MEPLYALEALLSSGSAPSRATLRTKAEDAIQIRGFAGRQLRPALTVQSATSPPPLCSISSVARL
jgi:hypothetical protein